MRFHDLRHTFGRSSFRKGEPVYVKEQWASSIQVIGGLYGHLIPGGNKQAVETFGSSREIPVGPRIRNPAATSSLHGRAGLIDSVDYPIVRGEGVGE